MAHSPIHPCNCWHFATRGQSMLLILAGAAIAIAIIVGLRLTTPISSHADRPESAPMNYADAAQR